MNTRFWIFIFITPFLFGCEKASQLANDVIDFVDTISDGAPCEVNEQCLGQYCIKAELDFPNGYCTTLKCEGGCSGLNSECFATELGGQPVNACFELCDGDGTCERASEGYVCVSFQDTAVCLPPNATDATAQGETGSACSNNTQCNGDNATCLTTFFGGYCSQYQCNTDGCLADNPCLSLNPEEPVEEQQFACFRGCTKDDDCRFQFACRDYNGTKVCLEGERTKARNPDGADDGAQCAAQINCKGATCIREQNNEEANDVSFPGGYCTTRDCVEATDCNGDALCVTRGRSTTCLAKCEADGDCRKGYACVDTPDGVGVCDSLVPQLAPEETDVFEIKCQSSKTATFEIPAGSEGFYIGPFTRDGKKIIPQTLEEPNGTTLNIPKDYSWFAINPDILGSLSPLVFPGSDRSVFKNRFTGGTYKLTVQTAASEWCYYTIAQPKEGTTLFLNLYLIGIDGVTAANAASNSNLEQVIANVTAIYRKMGIRAEVANYIDAEKSVSDLYSTIRDFNDIYNLVATSSATGTRKEDVLSVNVFLINDFNISEAPGILGISTGIPGMAGLHGSSGSGLVFSAASLGSDNRQLGQTMAHEIGHYLGLRHTTEHSFLGHDPITDTPECVNPNLATLCEDSSNFMFAFALGGEQQVVTNGQTYVIRRNPLIQ